MPPSGVAAVMNTPEIRMESAREQPPAASANTTEQSQGRGPRVTIIEDSDASSREARNTEMREDALQSKRDSYAPRDSNALSDVST